MIYFLKLDLDFKPFYKNFAFQWHVNLFKIFNKAASRTPGAALEETNFKEF